MLTSGASHSREAPGTLNRHVIMVRITCAEKKMHDRLHDNLKIDSKSLESSQPSPRLFQRSLRFFLPVQIFPLSGRATPEPTPGVISKQTRTSKTYRGIYNGKGKARKTVERQPHDHHEKHI
jgi:hypothetical protein